MCLKASSNYVRGSIIFPRGELRRCGGLLPAAAASRRRTCCVWCPGGPRYYPAAGPRRSLLPPTTTTQHLDWLLFPCNYYLFRDNSEVLTLSTPSSPAYSS